MTVSASINTDMQSKLSGVLGFSILMVGLTQGQGIWFNPQKLACGGLNFIWRGNLYSNWSLFAMVEESMKLLYRRLGLAEEGVEGTDQLIPILAAGATEFSGISKAGKSFLAISKENLSNLFTSAELEQLFSAGALQLRGRIEDYGGIGPQLDATSKLMQGDFLYFLRLFQTLNANPHFQRLGLVARFPTQTEGQQISEYFVAKKIALSSAKGGGTFLLLNDRDGKVPADAAVILEKGLGRDALLGYAFSGRGDWNMYTQRGNYYLVVVLDSVRG